MAHMGESPLHQFWQERESVRHFRSKLIVQIGMLTQDKQEAERLEHDSKNLNPLKKVALNSQ